MHDHGQIIIIVMHAGRAVESLYDLPMELRAPASDVDSNAMQPCPAYERPQ